MGPKGPELDTDRLLSGHPEQMRGDAGAGARGPVARRDGGDDDRLVRPVGNQLHGQPTSDRDTGLGAWTEQNFVDTMRTGRHMGRGRPILPPMPWEMVGKLTDQDLKAVFAYLRTVPPVKNRVPQPTPPASATPAPAAPPAPAK